MNKGHGLRDAHENENHKNIKMILDILKNFCAIVIKDYESFATSENTTNGNRCKKAEIYVICYVNNFCNMMMKH